MRVVRADPKTSVRLVAKVVKTFGDFVGCVETLYEYHNPRITL